MSDLRNWASGAAMAGFILLGPIIAFVILISAEVLTDLVTRVGASAIWPVAAGAAAWVLLRKYAGQPASQLRSEGV